MTKENENVCENHVITQENHAISVDIPITIDGKLYTVEQAREIYNKLNEIFGEVVVRYFDPYYNPYYPVEPVMPWITSSYTPYYTDPITCIIWPEVYSNSEDGE